MRKYVSYIIFSTLLGCLFFLYGFSSERNSKKKITKVEVEFTAGSNEFLTHEMVDKLLIQKGKSIKKQTKRVLDLHSLEERVLSNPYIEEATVFLTINGVLKTKIKQREPIARIIDENKSYYLDRYSVEIPLSSNYSARVPLISGIQSKEDIKEITNLVNRILEDDFLMKEVVGIQKTVADEYVFNVRSGDYKIDFGKFTNIDVKFKKLKAFYNKAYADKTIKNYTIINVKYHNQVVCTK
ncbi:cell division protein FtsQ/DivIB [Tenacibaculum maritimum]|uniref:cell division protein FtsQ/DivIB n=1 Tax=Tenacibaculum maritimum TaxID=107401 RepID=UPI0012E49CEE|nr:cell division protein FtsQ [Tenacibaculum maritimum]CAA0172221.1 Cell division protein FtsQ [Tenacibaculum maritimum]CAA0185863.1 Cell division protein FtsQ [Tenacibaculum maritimum]CAA0191854.1 Cell division protein FtsQ [Tenacibaculum maritimum]